MVDTSTEQKICKRMLDLSSSMLTQHIRIWDVGLKEV